MSNYNGYKNYETWCVNLNLTNDQGSYFTCVDMAHSAWEANPDEAREILADNIKEYVEEFQPEMDGMYSDLLGYALGQVDWEEIADNFLEGIDEE